MVCTELHLRYILCISCINLSYFVKIHSVVRFSTRIFGFTIIFFWLYTVSSMSNSGDGGRCVCVCVLFLYIVDVSYAIYIYIYMIV